MAMLTVYFLLLLCSMYAGTRGACPDDSYCPAGSDCSKNSSLCEAGMCDLTAVPSCVKGVSVALSSDAYKFNEDVGDAELVLTLDGPITCCSVSVAVKFESGTAKGGEDYVTTKDGYVIVKFAAGQTLVPFHVSIIDDDFMEGDEKFTVSIFDLSVPLGVTLGFDNSAEITIIDNDSTSVSFRKSTFRVKENAGQVPVELVLSVPAPFNTTVIVTTQNKDLSVSCDRFSAATHTVTIVSGTTSAVLPIEIADDGIYEGDESFTLEILNSLQNLVTLGRISTATVVIEEDEDKITANFDQKMYTVQEHDGSLAPKIMLAKPSPCCFILHAQLMNMTAEGRTVDFGYKSPKIYNYTFNVGSTCASPDANISITDDMKKEDEETFKISIIDYSLPFGVVSGGPATITINDNDNCVSFDNPEKTVSEDERLVFLQVCLEKPAANDLIIPVVSSDITAKEGIDFASGPYNVTIAKGQKCRYFSISLLDNMVFEGEKKFEVSFQTSQLPIGVVPCTPSEVEITILDDEYDLCFDELSYEVVEGDRLDFDLVLSRRLPSSLSVTFKYYDVTAVVNSDYYIRQRSISLSAGSNGTSTYLSTREDSIQESLKESFQIEIDYDGKPNNTNCNLAVVTILDDDDLLVSFERAQYSVSESTSLFTLRLRLNKAPTSTFSVTIYEEDGDAKGGVDYELQQYRNVRFINGGSRYYDLKIEPMNDNIVECDEDFSLRIETNALPPRVISFEPTTKITLKDYDKTHVTIDEDKLKFSEEVGCDLEIRVDYFTGTPRSLIYILITGGKEVTLDDSRTIQRITVFICDCLSTSRFTKGSSKIHISR